jgi:hypothetical protein
MLRYRWTPSNKTHKKTCSSNLRFQKLSMSSKFPWKAILFVEFKSHNCFSNPNEWDLHDNESPMCRRRICPQTVSGRYAVQWDYTSRFKLWTDKVLVFGESFEKEERPEPKSSRQAVWRKDAQVHLSSDCCVVAYLTAQQRAYR